MKPSLPTLKILSFSRLDLQPVTCRKEIFRDGFMLLHQTQFMNYVLGFLGGVGMQELLVIGLFVLIFFGAKKIPEFMKSLGKGAREFKEGMNSVRRDMEEEQEERPTSTGASKKSAE